MKFNLDVLKIDPVQHLEKLTKFIVDQMNVVFRRKGIIVGLSGGIDSACIAAVAVHAIGKEKVIGLVLPESESNPISSEYAIKHAQGGGKRRRRGCVGQRPGVRPRHRHPVEVQPEYRNKHRGLF